MHVHGTSSVQQCTAVLHLVFVVNHHMNKKCEDFVFKVGMLECSKLRVVDKLYYFRLCLLYQYIFVPWSDLTHF